MKMKPDTEFALVYNVTKADWFHQLMRWYFTSTSKTKEQKFQVVCDELMKYGALEVVETANAIIAYPHGTRRKRPAFLYVHDTATYENYEKLFDWDYEADNGVYRKGVVRAGKHFVAEFSQDTGI